MTAREHHFVPQFFLRNFSTNGKQIGMFNFAKGLALPAVSIKHQCSRRNFYGFIATLEDELSKMEGATAAVVRAILQNNSLPKNEAQTLALLEFLIFQHLRTAAISDRIAKMTDQFAKIVLRDNPKFAHIDLEKYLIRPSNPVALALSNSAHVVLAALDLKLHLFINKTGRDFVIGDDPVVLHNQFCEGIDYQGVLGWHCSGLQVSLPLSPHHLLFLYDSTIYKVDRAHKGVGTTIIDSENEVRVWNKLQILNCLENVYHSNISRTATAECQLVSSSRPRTRIKFVETNRIPTEGDGSKSLIHHFEPMLPMRFASEFISIRRAACRIPVDERASMYRNLTRDTRPEARHDRTADAERYFVDRVTER